MSTIDQDGPTLSGPRSNALQSRIAGVLSGSYADLEVRDALTLLDERGLKNDADTRRNFRLDMQQELIECHGEIVHDFGRIAAQLRRVGAAVDVLTNSCREIQKHVVAAGREVAPVLEEADQIAADQQRVQTKQLLLKAFYEHFVVSETDLAQLTSTAEPVHDEFFRILACIKQIQHDSQTLLGSENQRLGLEILDHSTRHLDAGYQKLYRWIQREFKSLDLENPQISTSIRRALRELAERPPLFQNCLDHFAEAREDTLSRNFYAALTGTSVDGSRPAAGKAIELSAHDPIRYVSDMLAWAHSATVSEKEALEVLFISDGAEIAKSIKAGIESEPWSRLDDSQHTVPFDGRRALDQLVDRDLAGVFRLLKQRIEQVLQSHDDATLAYKISNLILFYCNIFKTVLGAESQLLGDLRPLSETALRSFKAIMRDHVVSLQTDLAAPPEDLSPPDFLVDALANLQVLMKSYDTSIVESDPAKRSAGFRAILQDALYPFISGCENMAQRLRSPDGDIFAINCLLTAEDSMQKYSFASDSAELRPKFKAHREDLVEVTHEWLLREAGLLSLLPAVTTANDLNAYYHDPRRLIAAAQTLDAFLPTATEDALSFLGKLEDRALARRIIGEASEQFCLDFERVQMRLEQADEIRMAQENGDGAEEMLLRDMFHRTTEEIRVLLS